MRLLESVRDEPKSIAQVSRIVAAQNLSAGIVQSYLKAPIYDNSECEAMQTSLTPIILEASELAAQLWTRKSRVEIGCWVGLIAAGDPLKLVYSADAKALQPHSLHNREIDDDPTAMDGREVILICSPMVGSSGNLEGKEYEKQVLVKKALVWMG